MRGLMDMERLKLKSSYAPWRLLSITLWHVNNSNWVLRPVDVSKVDLQNVYKVSYKNYEVMK